MLGRAGKPALRESPPGTRVLELSGLGEGLQPEVCPPVIHMPRVEIWFPSWVWVQGVNPLVVSMPAERLSHFGAGQACCWKMCRGLASRLRGTQAGPAPWKDALFLQHLLHGMPCHP